MKTSKVKEVTNVKEWAGSNGTVYYHNLIMENGDKINIGKKKQLNVGDELTWELTEQDGSSEYPKAKTVNPEFQKKQADNTKGIEVGHAINNAVNLICAGVELEIPETVHTNEQRIYHYAKRILLISEQLKSE